MRTPVQVTFRDMPVSDAIEARCWQEALKLERYFDGIIACHVTIAASHRRHQQGNLVQVHIHLTVPGYELAVSRDAPGHQVDEDVEVAIREAFDTMRRRLQDYLRVMRGQVKSHASMPTGRVVRLFATDGYGFIRADDGREVYFHRNSVRRDAFDAIEIGAAVRFTEEPGERGPQAASVTRIA